MNKVADVPTIDISPVIDAYAMIQAETLLYEVNWWSDEPAYPDFPACRKSMRPPAAKACARLREFKLRGPRGRCCPDAFLRPGGQSRVPDEVSGKSKEPVRMTHITISTISLTELKQEELRKCATEMGLFYLTEYGMSEEDHRLARDVAMDVFERFTPEEKQALTTKVGTIRRGFSGLEAESTALVTNTGEYSDYSMCFSMGISHNLFPSPQFAEVWTDYFNRLYGVAQDIARAVLNSPGTYNGGNMATLLDCDPVLRLRYFPEVPEHRVSERVPLRMAPHYDLSIITLIHQTPCANGFVSLQAKIGDELVDLPAVPGAVLVLCGAVATLVTQGAVPAPKHHVAAPPAHMRVGSGRTSSVFFLRPRPTFTFSVPNARKYGLNVSIDADTATFGDWIGTNYLAMHTAPESRTPLTEEP